MGTVHQNRPNQNRPGKNGPELQLWDMDTSKIPPSAAPKAASKTPFRTASKTAPGARTAPRHTGHKTPQRTGAARPVQSIQRRRARKRRAIRNRCLFLAVFLLFLVGVFHLTGFLYRGLHTQGRKDTNVLPASGSFSGEETDNPIDKPVFTVDLLEPNKYSRPGTKLKKVKNIFVHYTANPGTNAQQNRSYFANLAETGERSASAHFIIGYEGEILQCIPLNEEAYAVKGRNDDSISIECCYLSDDGAFTQSTYDSLIDLLAWLCGEYGLTEQDILRHYDEGGKKCPLYYVEHEDEWELLLEDVGAALKRGNTDIAADE